MATPMPSIAACTTIRMRSKVTRAASRCWSHAGGGEPEPQCPHCWSNAAARDWRDLPAASGLSPASSRGLQTETTGPPSASRSAGPATGRTIADRGIDVAALEIDQFVDVVMRTSMPGCVPGTWKPRQQPFPASEASVGP